MEEGIMEGKTKIVYKFKHRKNCVKIFKWFLAINFLILLAFCSYALFGLYQLASAIRINEEEMKLDRRFDKFNISITSTEQYNNNNNNSSDPIVSDFREWRNSILQGLNERNQGQGEKTTSASHNLNVLLHTIGSIMKNFANGTLIAPKNEIVVANLTDVEIRLLQEYTRLTSKGRDGKNNLRVRRAYKSVQNSNTCNMQFYIDTKNEPHFVIKPVAVGEGQINIINSVNTVTNGNSVSNTTQCTFKVFYEPKSPV